MTFTLAPNLVRNPKECLDLPRRVWSNEVVKETPTRKALPIMSHFMVVSDPTAEICGMRQFTIFPDGNLVTEGEPLNTIPFDVADANEIHDRFMEIPDIPRMLSLAATLAEVAEQEVPDDDDAVNRAFILGTAIMESLLSQGETMAAACLVASLMLRTEMGNGGLID